PFGTAGTPLGRGLGGCQGGRLHNNFHRHRTLFDKRGRRYRRLQSAQGHLTGLFQCHPDDFGLGRTEIPLTFFRRRRINPDRVGPERYLLLGRELSRDGFRIGSVRGANNPLGNQPRAVRTARHRRSGLPEATSVRPGSAASFITPLVSSIVSPPVPLIVAAIIPSRIPTVAGTGDPHLRPPSGPRSEEHTSE